MGEWLIGLRLHRRAIALGAVVLLPLSTPAATASVARPVSVPLMPASAGSLQATLPLVISPVPLPSTNVDKPLPAGWSGPDGHTPVVVGTVKQRVAQVSATTSHDIPQAALNAYRNAQASLATSDPGCHLSWTLLAGIGQVESDNGRYGGAVVLSNGDTSPHILGPVLNGTGGVGAIRDTDGGRYDGDPVWDRAVGPMQFIPGTWAGYGADGNADGLRDPNNIADAALGAARYLCSSGGDLRVVADLRAAVMRYNHSSAYVDLVLRLAYAYAHGAATVIPSGSAAPKPPADDPRGTGQKSGAASHQPRHEGFGRVPGSGRHGGSGGTGGSGGRGGGSGGGGHPVPPPIHTDPPQKPPTTTTPVKPTPVSPAPGSPTPPPASPPAPPATTPVPTPPTPPTPPSTPRPPLAPHHTKPGHSTPTVVVTDLLRPCKAGWCVGTTVLDFGVDADFAQRLGDLNGDGKTRSLVRELRALRGLTMTVELVRPPAASDGETNGTAAVDPAAVSPTPRTAPTARTAATAGAAKVDDPAPVVITVDTDGHVLSINGIAYVAPDSPAADPTP